MFTLFQDGCSSSSTCSSTKKSKVLTTPRRPLKKDKMGKVS